MKKVYILDRLLHQYRKEFFEGLKIELANRDIELKLLYGKSKNILSKKKDEIDLDWADYIPYKSFNIGSSEIIWQPYLNKIKDADLVIIEHANRLLLNYILHGFRPFSKSKLAYWGHIRNMQENEHSVKNSFKNSFTTKCDWWFTYTESGIKELEERNFPTENITVVQNAIDTNDLRLKYDSITEKETAEFKSHLKLSSENIGIYCGGMYEEKRLNFLLEACHTIRKEIKDFIMIFIGGGDDAEIIKKAAAGYPWIKYYGPQFGMDKVKMFKISNVQLMPGLVGLGILDSFVLETPILTTKYPYHSPEIEYLTQGENGLISENNLEDYSNLVINAFKEKTYDKLKVGGRESSKKYTVEKMVENFADGVSYCLSK